MQPLSSAVIKPAVGRLWLTARSPGCGYIVRDVITSPAGVVAKCCDEYVCVSVCPSVRKDISRTTRAIFTKRFVHAAYVRLSVLLRHVYDRPHRLSAGTG